MGHMVSTEDVIMAYRLLLGREPENAAVVAYHAETARDLAALRETFLTSDEFNASRAPQLSVGLDQGGPMHVEVDVHPALLRQMFARVEQTWQALGVTEPFWSVLSSDVFRRDRFSENAAHFYDSGRYEIDRLTAWLRRNDVPEIGPGSSCCEYGCGTGRVTRWLAPHFARVVACDISSSHLQLAERYLCRAGISNVVFQRIDSPLALNSMEPVDLVLSSLVLQHNPPPVIAFTLERILHWLKPAGIAFFQVPTYLAGYEFRAESYLSRPPSGEIEVHLLPQRHVYAIAAKARCRVLEVQPDGLLGQPHWISTTFLLRKDPG
jgi:SAM-dependent methyltransferase